MSDGPDVGELSTPDRTLMGPGPSPVHPRVTRAMSAPVLGHLDPAFLEVMDETQELLRYAFRTENPLTLAVSGTGSAAMEAAVGNVVEPGDAVLVPANGYFGDRMAEMAARAGGEVARVDATWGEPVDPDVAADAMAEHDPDVFGFVHAETSTGTLQTDVPELVAAAHDHDALVIADTVTSLGGVEMRVDEWGIDVAYSVSQKCLSCPPGASPITLSAAAREKVAAREEPVRSWYLDLTLLAEYWGEERSYHHTMSSPLVYALREGLRMVAEEGVEERWARHRKMAGALKAGVEAMGLGLAPEDDYWLPSLNAVRLPDGVDDGDVIDYLLSNYDIEVAGGLGASAGEVLRVGCMGYGARPRTVTLTVAALADAFEALGGDVDPGAGLAATREALR